jgi:hypothetical protein
MAIGIFSGQFSTYIYLQNKYTIHRALNTSKNRFIRELKYVRLEEKHNVVTERKVQETKILHPLQKMPLFE